MTSAAGGEPWELARGDERAVLAVTRQPAVPSLSRLLRDLQVELLDAAPMHLRSVIDAQLGRMGALLNAVRLTLWRVEPEGDEVAAEFEWFRSPLPPLRNARFSLEQFPLATDALLRNGPTVVLDERAAEFFDAREVLAIPLTGRGRLLRLLTVGWNDRSTPAPLALDQAAIDSLYTLTAIVHASAEASVLAERASYDEVTGLANRRLVLFMLNHLLSRLGRSNRGGVGVIFCELAEQTVAEDVVVRVARAFQQLTRATDIVGRFDERMLAVLCDDLRDPDEAVEVAKRLSAACSSIDGADGLAACFGVGFSNESVATGVLLRRADLASYQARGDGQGAIRVVSS